MSRPRRPRPEGATDGADPLAALVERGVEPGGWDDVHDTELPLLAFQLALYFGVRRDADAATALSSLYARVVERRSVAERMELCDRVSEAVRGGASSALALLPFLQRERDAGVASAAALAFAALLTAPPEDPLAGPRMLRTLLDHAEDDAVRIGLVSGLLALGDRRVLPFAAGAWRTLTASACVRLLESPPPFTSVLYVEWLLDWLEDAGEGMTAPLSRALARAATSGRGRVLDLERMLPEREGAELRVVGEWEAREYGERLAPRLRDLARREGNAAALAGALAAWGVS